MKKEVSLPHLQEAAMLHDYVKVLIPDNVLNKVSRLDNQEREIMNLHSELGYEILKNTDIDTRTLHLSKYHHQNEHHNQLLQNILLLLYLDKLVNAFLLLINHFQ